ncbi:hypothetical protein EYF80_004892 [Liparis tanakae]|uniref:Uncharacterized protein n=1 Tax=Liparis tanakae TaxID=230148 RepID=A0A4Z2J4A1_9TELE|nr:hypothetical protein EYF80_004892 [Liparis tanakae]
MTHSALEATHRGEAEGRDGKAVCSRLPDGVRGGRGPGRVEAAGLQRILKPRGAQIAVRLALELTPESTELVTGDRTGAAGVGAGVGDSLATTSLTLVTGRGASASSSVASRSCFFFRSSAPRRSFSRCRLMTATRSRMALATSLKSASNTKPSTTCVSTTQRKDTSSGTSVYSSNRNSMALLSLYFPWSFLVSSMRSHSFRPDFTMSSSSASSTWTPLSSWKKG